MSDTSASSSDDEQEKGENGVSLAKEMKKHDEKLAAKRRKQGE